MRFLLFFALLAPLTATPQNSTVIAVTPHEKAFLLSYQSILQLLSPHKKPNPTLQESITRGPGSYAIAKFGMMVQQIVPLIAPESAVPIAVFSTIVSTLGDFVAEDEEYQAYKEFKKQRGIKSLFCLEIDHEKDFITSQLLENTNRILRSQDPIDQSCKKELLKQIIACTSALVKSERQPKKSLTIQQIALQNNFYSLILLNFFIRSYDLFMALKNKLDTQESSL
jgi:hypothetical protein